MNAIIYCRVSTKDQVNEGLSLQNQEKECRKYAERNGFVLAAEPFIEEGESAKSADRTQLIKAISFCAENRGNIDALIVWKLDRFSRNTEDHFLIKTTLTKYGVKLHSVTEPINETPQGQLMETVLAGFAQFDNDIRTERSKTGMEQRVKEGRWVFGRIPLGYLASKDEGNKTILIQDPSTSEIIKKAFTEYSTGVYSQLDIMNMVNRAGLKTKSGKKISSQLINKILRNPVYAGFIRNPWENKLEKGLHEGIVGKAIFDACQSVRNGFKPTQVTRQRYNPEFPLRGLIRCHQCGRALTGSKSKGKTKKYGYYHCYACSGVLFRSDAVNEQFQTLLEEIKPSVSYVQDFKQMCLSVWNDEYKDTNLLRRKINSEILQLEDKKDKIIDLLALGKISDSDCESRMTKLKVEILEKQMHLGELREKEYNIEELLNHAEWFLTRTDKIWSGLEPELKQKFQQFIFPEGLTYSKDGFVGTPVLSQVYAIFDTSVSKKSTLAVPRGVEPLLPG